MMEDKIDIELEKKLNYLNAINFYESDIVNNEIIKLSKDDLIFKALGYNPSEMIKINYFLQMNNLKKDEILEEIASIEDPIQKKKKLNEHLEFIKKYNNCYTKYLNFINNEILDEARVAGKENSSEILDYIAHTHPLITAKNLHLEKINEIMEVIESDDRLLSALKKEFKFYNIAYHHFQFYLVAIEENDIYEFETLRKIIIKNIQTRYGFYKSDSFSNIIDYVVNHRLIYDVEKPYTDLICENFDVENILYFPEIYIFQAMVSKVMKDFEDKKNTSND